MFNVGIIGYGYWGPNLVRNFNNNNRVESISIADNDISRLNLAREHFPNARLFKESKELLTSLEIDVIAIATPVHTHFSLALEALENGKHIWLEKPLTETVEQAEKLLEVAQRNNKIIFVDHTFIYSSPIKKIKELIDNKSLGNLYYYDSTRINLGLFQKDVDVTWDIAVHDLSILLYLFGREPLSISAQGVSHIKEQPIDTAYVTLKYENDFIAHINVNWLSPIKVRQILIGGDKSMLVYDDLNTKEKIKVFNSGVSLDEKDNSSIQYHSGEMIIPELSNEEPLMNGVNHFLDCIEKGVSPVTDGLMGLQTVKILTKIKEILNQGEGRNE